MGLRFRKTISILPGINLNFGKSGISISAGIPGFRKTFHTSGKVTTSIGIPGTGLYHVDVKHPDKKSRNKESHPLPRKSSNNKSSDNHNVINHIDEATLISIHKSSDDTVDWHEVKASPTPPNSAYNENMWKYYHTMATKILSGDIDAYLQVIYEVNPLDDLLVYSNNYEFGTDDPKKIEVEFDINKSVLPVGSNSENNILLRDFICSLCIRIARDMFALLPVENVITHGVFDKDTILSVNFDKATLSKVKFGYTEPLSTVQLFKHNMMFSENNGFKPVKCVE